MTGLVVGWCSGFVFILCTSGGSLAASSSTSTLTALAASRPLVHDIEIVTSHFRENLTWLAASRVPVIICDKAGGRPLPPGMYADIPCSMHLNRGNEGASYLAYIVSRYESLPSRVAFLHGHENSSHQHHPSGSMLRAIETARPELGYVSLNNDWHVLGDTDDDIPNDARKTTRLVGVNVKHWNLTRSVWARTVQPITHTALPRYVRTDRAAQFVVRRERILQHPKRLYEKLLDTIVYHQGYENWNNRVGGMTVEIAWPLLFEGSNDICEALSECTREAAIEWYFDLNQTFTRVLKTPEEMRDEQKARERVAAVLLEDTKKPSDTGRKALLRRA